MAGGGLQKAGGILSVLAVVAAVTATIIGTPAAGAAVLTASESLAVSLLAYAKIAFLASAALNIAGQFVTPIEPESGADSRRESPNYGFAQFTNPTSRDAVVPFVYSADGVPVAPPYVQAFTTPRGWEHGDEFARLQARKGQSLSALWAVACHRVSKFEDLRIGGEPVWTNEVDVEIGVGNGTKRDFLLAPKNVDLDSLEVSVGGSPAWGQVVETVDIRILSGRWLYFIDLDETFDDSVPVKLWVAGTPRGTFTRADAAADATTLGARFRAWLITETRMAISLQGYTPETFVGGPTLRVQYGARRAFSTFAGLTATKNAKGKVRLRFAAATVPAAGAKVVASYRRKNMGGARVHIRYGVPNQLPIPGFSELRTTQSHVRPMPKSTDVTVESVGPVHDFLVTIASESEFRQYEDDEDGGTRPVKAQVSIDWRQPDSSGNFTGPWKKLRNPNGARRRDNRNAYEFQLADDAGNKQFWTFSLRGILKEEADGSGDRTDLNAFRYDRVQVRCRRTNPVSTNLLWRDSIEFWSYTEIRDFFLSFAGVATLGVHNAPAKKIGGSLPSARVRMTSAAIAGVTGTGRGDAALEAFRQTGTVENASSNILAAVDLIQHEFGGGEYYGAADIDAGDVYVAHEHVTREVSLGQSETEQAHRISFVLDTRTSLLDAVAQMLAPARIIPFQQGNTWRFAIDEPENLSSAAVLASIPTFYDDDGELGRISEGEIGFQRLSLASVVSSVMVEYVDGLRDFEKTPIWASPLVTRDEERIERIELLPVTRRTEAARFAIEALLRSLNAGIDVSFKVPATVGIRLVAGTMVRIVSNRCAVSRYFRVMDVRFGTDSWMVEVVGREYVSAAHSEAPPAQVTLRSPFVDDAALRAASEGVQAANVSVIPASTTTSSPPVAVRRRVSRRVRVREIASRSRGRRR